MHRRPLVVLAAFVVCPSIVLASAVTACSAPASATEPAQAPTPTPAAPAATSEMQPGDTRLCEQPAVSAHNVAFVYAGDLWVANLDGTNVRRLTSHPGEESRPRFSPDGATIAFSGSYDGNVDVYVVPVEGGEPKRLTWHPGADLVQDFTPDGGSVAFTSQRDVHTRRFWHLFRVPVAGGHPTSYELPTCTKAALSPDGKKIAYTPLGEAFTQWKNYRGGTASRIWIYDVADHSVVQIPQPEGRCNDTDPMWIGDRLYFRSDRAGEFNVFAYDPKAKSASQLTRHEDFPIQNASSGAQRIVYEQAGWIHLFDPATSRAGDRVTSQATRLVLDVRSERVETRPRFVHGDDYVRSASLSPSGARVALGYRGEVVTLPAEKGDFRNLSDTPGANERFPVWSPDGTTIAWFSDASGENQLVLAPQDGRGEKRSIALDGAGFYGGAQWSPDGKRIAFTDNSRTLRVLEVESGVSKVVAQDPIYGVFANVAHAWSPDSRWLAYALGTKTGFKRVEIYDTTDGAKHTVTDGLSDVSEPVFDAGGKYLYLTASTDAGPFLTWFSQASSDVEQTNSLYLVCLAKDTPSPLSKESDEEASAKQDAEAAEKAGTDAAKGGVEKDDAKPAVPAVVIDFDGLAQRIVALPLPRAFYTGLVAGEPGQLWYQRAERGPFAEEPAPSAIARFDLKERKEKRLLEEVQYFQLSADRKKVLVSNGAGLFVRPVGDSIELDKGKLAIDSIRVRIEPRVEWRAIFDEAWRINRDCFYDPGMHGADWPAMKTKYAAFLPHLATRGDLTRVIRWMCSELAVGHHRTSGGDTLVKSDAVPGGLLGADYEVADGRYRFHKVYGGLNWTPDLRAPLTEPGVQVAAGDYLLAVDGRDLRADEDVFARFEFKAGQRVELTVGPNADGSGSRQVVVVPIDDETALRNRDWVEGNIRRVTEATNGRVAYVHVPNTAEQGFVYFKRYFFPQSDREAIIVDERHNGGGSVADYYIDILRRPYVAHWATRYGASFATPQAAIFGPKVMLIDETAGSGGDLLPWMFRKFQLGKLIGRPTWGGLVGVLGFPEFIDGGEVSAPNLGFWTEEEGFGVENVGVPPDIEVEQWPALVREGHDPQLERAIEEILKELDAHPRKPAKQPPFPVRVRR